MIWHGLSLSSYDRKAARPEGRLVQSLHLDAVEVGTGGQIARLYPDLVICACRSLSGIDALHLAAQHVINKQPHLCRLGEIETDRGRRVERIREVAIHHECRGDFVGLSSNCGRGETGEVHTQAVIAAVERYHCAEGVDGIWPEGYCQFHIRIGGQCKRRGTHLEPIRIVATKYCIHVQGFDTCVGDTDLLGDVLSSHDIAKV